MSTGCAIKYPLHRLCFWCGRVIYACNGSVLTRDMVAAELGLIPRSFVRERCGFCVERSGLIGAAAFYPGADLATMKALGS